MEITHLDDSEEHMFLMLIELFRVERLWAF